LYEKAGEDNCSDTLTNESFDYLAEKLPEIYFTNIANIVIEIIMMIAGVYFLYSKMKNKMKVDVEATEEDGHKPSGEGVASVPTVSTIAMQPVNGSGQQTQQPVQQMYQPVPQMQQQQPVFQQQQQQPMYQQQQQQPMYQQQQQPMYQQQQQQPMYQNQQQMMQQPQMQPQQQWQQQPQMQPQQQGQSNTMPATMPTTIPTVATIPTIGVIPTTQ
jgi:FtsZ-interacting cell division protein ZipA